VVNETNTQDVAEMMKRIWEIDFGTKETKETKGTK
jgi:hypothetical protein